MLLIIRCLLYNIFYNDIEVKYMENTELLNKLGQRIKQLRLNSGLSQEKFALQIEMDRTYFASIESGKRNVSILNIKKIADGLNVTLSQLFETI